MENDLISRNTLVEAIQEYQMNLFHDKFRLGEIDLNSASVLANVERIVCEAPSVEAEPKWISVEDGLPEENGYYLCWVDTSSVGKRKEYEHRKLYWEENLWLSSAKSFKVEHPLYWMPLPEPPKMDGGAE